MTNNIKRVEADCEDSNAAILVVIQTEITAINTLGGTVVAYNEFYSVGKNTLAMTIIYTLP